MCNSATCALTIYMLYSFQTAQHLTPGNVVGFRRQPKGHGKKPPAMTETGHGSAWWMVQPGVGPKSEVQIFKPLIYDACSAARFGGQGPFSEGR